MTKTCENCFWCETDTCTNINSEYANKPIKEDNSCTEFAFLPEKACKTPFFKYGDIAH